MNLSTDDQRYTMLFYRPHNGQRAMDVERSNFEYRRTAMWVANRWLVYACIVACLLLTVMSILNLPAPLAWTAGTLVAGLLALTVGRVVRALHLLYRCQHCGTLPYRTLNEYKCGGLGPARANFMSPRICPQCGTQIR